MISNQLRVELENGKYTYVLKESGSSEIYRYGETWRDTTGDNAILCMAFEIDRLRAELSSETAGDMRAARIKSAKRWMIDMIRHKLHATVRPEKFMPPLSEWPSEATLIVMKAAYHSGAVFIFYDKHHGRHLEEVSLDIPSGIDPRIEVSRAQMEAYENG